MKVYDEEIPCRFAKDIKKAILIGTLKMLLASIAILIMCLLCTFPLHMILQDVNLGWLYVLFLLLITALVVCLGLRPTLRHRKKLLAQLAGLGALQADALEREREEADILYKTVYLLTDYLYFPNIICLIPYGEIENMETIYHSTNGVYDGAQLVFRLAGNKKLTVQMKKARRFRSEHSWFVQQLNRKIEGTASAASRREAQT